MLNAALTIVTRFSSKTAHLAIAGVTIASALSFVRRKNSAAASRAFKVVRDDILDSVGARGFDLCRLLLASSLSSGNLSVLFFEFRLQPRCERTRQVGFIRPSDERHARPRAVQLIVLRGHVVEKSHAHSSYKGYSF